MKWSESILGVIGLKHLIPIMAVTLILKFIDILWLKTAILNKFWWNRYAWWVIYVKNGEVIRYICV